MENKNNEKFINLVKTYNESELPFIRINTMDNQIIFANKAATPLLRSLGCLVNTTFPIHILFSEEEQDAILSEKTSLETEDGIYEFEISISVDLGFTDLLCSKFINYSQKGSTGWHSISHHEAIL